MTSDVGKVSWSVTEFKVEFLCVNHNASQRHSFLYGLGSQCTMIAEAVDILHYQIFQNFHYARDFVWIYYNSTIF